MLSGSVPEPPLRCLECGALSDSDAVGWRAYIAFIAEDGEPPETAIYCPTCAELEFGDP
jgi:hypothetical protein